MCVCETRTPPPHLRRAAVVDTLTELACMAEATRCCLALPAPREASGPLPRGPRELCWGHFLEAALPPEKPPSGHGLEVRGWDLHCPRADHQAGPKGDGSGSRRGRQLLTPNCWLTRHLLKVPLQPRSGPRCPTTGRRLAHSQHSCHQCLDITPPSRASQSLGPGSGGGDALPPGSAAGSPAGRVATLPSDS